MLVDDTEYMKYKIYTKFLKTKKCKTHLHKIQQKDTT